jgi:hypothetical protein
MFDYRFLAFKLNDVSCGTTRCMQDATSDCSKFPIILVLMKSD